MDQLNQQQWEAVTTTEGPVLIIAGPGTGKTKTLVERVRYLLVDKKVPGEHITITTFTKKAAQELLSRISQALLSLDPSIPAKVHAGNFHQLAQAILDKYPQYLPYRKYYQQIDDKEQIYLILHNIEALYEKADLGVFFGPLQKKNRYYQARDLATWLDQLREGFIDFSHDSQLTEQAKYALQVYGDLLIDHNLMDFSALLWYALQILEKHEDALVDFQETCKYLMVDEYQDTNPIQEKIIRLLSQKTGNLCVVGDDDQSLYRFRGATVQNLLSFEDRYPQAKRIQLNVNYRSDEKILNFSSQFLNKPYRDMEFAREEVDGEKLSDYRFSKNLISYDPDNYHANAVQSLLGNTAGDLVNQVVNLIKDLEGHVDSLNQIAILSHSVKSPLMQEVIRTLRQEGIPVQVSKEGSLMSFQEVKRMVGAYVFTFQESLLKIYEQNPAVQADLAKYSSYYSDMPQRGAGERIRIANAFLSKLDQGMEPLSLGHAFLSAPPFSTIIDKALEGNRVSLVQLDHLSSFLQNLKRFSQRKHYLRLNRTNIFDFVSDFFTDFLPYLEKARVDSSGQGEEVSLLEGDHINILTIHQAKGLEFPIVLLMEGEEKKAFIKYGKDPLGALRKTPGLGLDQNPRLEEDLDSIRLYYTAFTRAKNLLVLCGVDQGASAHNFALDPENKKEAIDRGSVAMEFLGMNASLPNYSTQNLEGLHFDRLKKDTLQETYFYTSHISVYQTCPRKYFFLSKLAIPERSNYSALYGTLVHRCIELIHRYVYDQSKRTQSIRVEEAWIRSSLGSIGQGMESLGVHFEEEDYDRAYEEVKNYLQDQAGTWMKRATGSEQTISFSTGEEILAGQVDLSLDQGRTIIDFKTGRPASENSKQWETYKKQLAYYRLIFNEIREEKGEEEENILYFTSRDAEEHRVDFSFSQTELSALQEEVLASIRSIENKEFSERTWDLEDCHYCPMNFYCNGLESLDKS